MPLILALDQGTTSSRAILFDEAGGIRGVAQREMPQIYPRPGWVEHDPADLWGTQLHTAHEVMEKAGVNARDIACIGITNQRETTILWERATGKPLHHAIVWQDRRTSDFCSALKREGRAAAIQERTGLVVDAYFSASKLAWLLDHVPDARERAARGELAFGTVDTWLLWNLTRENGHAVHATDISNASRTMLLNIKTGQWDQEMLRLFDIPRELLPEVRACDAHFGETKLLGPHAIPIHGMAGDQQAALFGQNCLSPGLAKNTYGTGCFMLMNAGDVAPVSKHQLLTTVAWRLGTAPATSRTKAIPTSKIQYALEGSVFVGGAVVQWLRDGLGIIKSAAEVETLAASVPDNGGVYLVPAFAGLGAPHWDQYARGTITGITRGTNAGHFARAAVESIAFQVADLLDVMLRETDAHIPELRVDGGASRNNVLLQFQADLLRVPVARPAITETTAQGAALLAALGAGVYKSTAELKALWKSDAVFEPQMPEEEAAHRRERWNAALSRARDWESPQTRDAREQRGLQPGPDK